MPRTKLNRKGRPTLLSRLSTSQIASELQRRHSLLPHLRAQRNALVQQLAQVDAEIAAIEPRTAGTSAAPARVGRPAGTRRGRGGNKQSLATVLHSLLQGKTMSVPEMAEAAKASGYKSTSKNFRTLISLALLSHKQLFKRVARGQYTSK